LRRNEPLDGVLVFSSGDPLRFTQELASDFLAHLGLVAALCIENAVNRARLLRSGLTDFLTGFHNRRYLHARLREELARAQRARRDRQVGNGDREAVDRGGGRGARAGHARLQGAGGTADGGGRRGALPGEERRAQPHRDVAERGHVGLIHVIALLLACAFFLLIHFVVSGTRLRYALVAPLGEGPYRGVFSLASLVGLLWMIRAYSHAPVIELWGKLPRLRPVAFAVVFVGVLL